MYIRFEARCFDEDNHPIDGIFWVAQYMYHHDGISPDEEDRVWQILDWYHKELPIPKRFARSFKKSAEKKALSWFKDTATEHLEKMYELREILHRHGAITDVLVSSRPGYVIYEDEIQVLAEPFKG